MVKNKCVSKCFKYYEMNSGLANFTITPYEPNQALEIFCIYHIFLELT